MNFLCAWPTLGAAEYLYNLGDINKMYYELLSLYGRMKDNQNVCLKSVHMRMDEMDLSQCDSNWV